MTLLIRSFFLQTANLFGMFLTLLDDNGTLYILPCKNLSCVWSCYNKQYTSVIALRLNYTIITSLHGLLWLNALIFTWVNQSNTLSTERVQLSELKESWHCWSMTIMRIWRTAGLAVVTDAITCDRC